MERFCVLLDRYIKDDAVQKRFKSSFCGLVAETEYVLEDNFKDELRAFIMEHPEFEKSVLL